MTSETGLEGGGLGERAGGNMEFCSTRNQFKAGCRACGAETPMGLGGARSVTPGAFPLNINRQ